MLQASWSLLVSCSFAHRLLRYVGQHMHHRLAVTAARAGGSTAAVSSQAERVVRDAVWSKLWLDALRAA